MLISVCTNAVMFRVNVQNVLYRLQRRLSVACAIHWSRCQSFPGPDGPIPPRHAGALVPLARLHLHIISWSSTSVIWRCLYTRSCRIPIPLRGTVVPASVTPCCLVLTRFRSGLFGGHREGGMEKYEKRYELFLKYEYIEFLDFAR